MSARPPSQLSARGLAVNQYLRSGVAKGMSAGSVLSSLQQAGLGYRRTDFLRDYSIVRGVEQAQERLRFVRKDRRPDPARIPEALTKTLRRYSTTVEISGFDEFTGENITRNITIASDELQTIQDYQDEAEDIVSDPERYQSMTVSNISVVSSVKSGASGSLL